MRSSSRLQLYCVFAAASAIPVFPQASSVVEISGIVTDPAGASLPGAQLKATQTDTGFARTASSGAGGEYLLSNLPIGPYKLEITADGFRPYVQQGIVLQVNTNPQINVGMQLGGVSQQVEVSANATMVESQTSGFSQVIDQRRVVDLPLNGRQATQLILLSGAAVPAPPSDIASTKNYPSSTTISVAGGQANGTYYLSDGGDHNDAFGRSISLCPFPTRCRSSAFRRTRFPQVMEFAPVPWSTS